MSKERKEESQGRMPEDVFDQLINLPSDAVQEQTCRKIFDGVASILINNGVAFDAGRSSYRVKSREDIRKKSLTRKSDSPVRDIYGVRFVVSEEDRFRVGKMIQPQFPLTPDFIDGRPSVREYADTKVRNYIREKFNPNIGEYSALHINLVFRREGAEVYDIAEVQIMTKRELEASQNNRGLYTNVRRNG